MRLMRNLLNVKYLIQTGQFKNGTDLLAGFTQAEGLTMTVGKLQALNHGGDT
jgi:hypothetical protein